MPLRRLALVLLVLSPLACGGSTPSPPLDAGEDAADDGPAVVTIIACENGAPCDPDAGDD
ncbi:MAG TPA: hypothetical protein VGH28_10635 [Polyangiaceae bacterium]